MNDEETREFLKKCGLDPNTPLGPPVTVTWDQLAKGVMIAVDDDNNLFVKEMEKKEP